MTDIYATLNTYGVSYSGEQGEYVPTEEDLSLAELAARGGRIVRVRWIGGDYIPGRGKCYDLSYVHGVIPAKTCTSCHGLGQHHFGGGESFSTSMCRECFGAGSTPEVRVRLYSPGANLVPRRQLKGEMIRWAKEEGVYAKALGLLDDGNFSILG